MVKNFAIIINGVVENVIAIDGDLVIQSDTAGRGDTYNPEAGTFTRPAPLENE